MKYFKKGDLIITSVDYNACSFAYIDDRLYFKNKILILLKYEPDALYFFYNNQYHIARGIINLKYFERLK